MLTGCSVPAGPAPATVRPQGPALPQDRLRRAAVLVAGHTPKNSYIRMSRWEPGFRYSPHATQVSSGAAVPGAAAVDRILVRSHSLIRTCVWRVDGKA